ncbi:interferon-induced protein with tetratricopeptide repeats 1B-like [Denticeps clupeoides]|uniref:interferon-induced protein with tetratricopeptide repeats 1B-like n=1 Tax=Denticeps clupeoides TaxID=299321 RepID=UPI0010A37B30|nr:interferon-induced protein with tetratricopeptide repeats 1B-like [Denticeps clupeoides]
MDGTNESQMKELECLFTWGVEKSDMKDLDTLLKNHLHRVSVSPIRYHATYFHILAFVSHLKGDDEAALDYLHKAEDALKKDKRDEADFVVTYSSLAWIHNHLGNQENKEFYLNQVKSIRQDTRPAVHGEKGWSLMKMGPKYYERAKESFEKALEIKPEHQSYNMGYGVVLYRMEDLDTEYEIQPEDSAAVKQLKKTLALYPDFTEAMTLLAVKKTQESRELVLKALSLSPNDKNINDYVVNYLKKCSPEESLEMIKSALVQTPTSAFLNHKAGLCYKEKYVQLIMSGRRDEAAADVKECIRFLSEAVRLDPSNTYAMMNLAEAYAEDHQLQMAVDIFKKALAQNPNSDILNLKAGLCYKKKYVQLIMSWRRDEAAADMKECIRFLSEAVRLDPSNTYAMMNLAEAYAEDNQLPRAEKIFTDLIRAYQLREKDKQHCHFIYGKFLFFKWNDEDRSVEQYKEAYKIHVYSEERKKVRKLLENIAETKGGQKGKAIKAFLTAEDKKRIQPKN